MTSQSKEPEVPSADSAVKAGPRPRAIKAKLAPLGSSPGPDTSRGGKPLVVNGEQLSEMELALTVLWNSIRRWMNQRRLDSEGGALSDLDVFVLHLVVYRNRALRVIDLAFALSIDDLHQVTYSLKKLVRMEMLSGVKQGKEVFYSATTRGREHYDEFIRDRRKYLEPSMQLVMHGEHDLEALINLLRTLSGVYEQAARSAASSRSA